MLSIYESGATGAHQVWRIMGLLDSSDVIAELNNIYDPNNVSKRAHTLVSLLPKCITFSNVELFRILINSAYVSHSVFAVQIFADLLDARISVVNQAWPQLKSDAHAILEIIRSCDRAEVREEYFSQGINSKYAQFVAQTK